MKLRSSNALAVLCILAPIVSTAPLLAAAEESGPWIEDAKGCKFHNPHPVPNETVNWSGGCRDGFGDGQGVLEWFEDGKAGTRYEGSFLHGELEGRGRFVTKDGGTYDGSFDKGTPSGFGTMIWANGTRYDGAWRDGKRTGRGTFTRTNGDRYDGDFVEGKWQGKGLYANPSGERYVGDWMANKRQGEGAAVFLDGGIYRGPFIDDVPAHPDEIRHNHYELKVEHTGSYIGKALITNLPLPVDKTYGELSEDEKFIARARAATPSETDEPPYPLYGPRRILEASMALENKLRVEGSLALGVTVDADGAAQDIAVLSSPDKELTTAMARVLMLQQYKPALCGGKPCAQKFYFRMNYHRRP